MQWVVDIYTLVLASLLMLSGATGDRFGRRRVFQIGLATFAVGSLLCSVAPTITMLIGARLIQAVAAPCSILLRCPSFRRSSSDGSSGPGTGVLGGGRRHLDGTRPHRRRPAHRGRRVARRVLDQPADLCRRDRADGIFVPETKSATMRDIDPVGQLLAVLSLFGLVFVLIEGPGMGWTNPRILAIAVTAAVAFVAFLRYESRRHDPFIDLRFFRSIPFSSATVTAVCAFAGWGAFLFMMSLYLQGERGYSAAHTGLIYLPIAVGALFFSPLSGRLVGRFGARPSLLISGILMVIASVMLTFLTPTTPVWALLVIFAVYGIGFGMVNAPITNAAVSGMPKDGRVRRPR